MAYPSHRRSRRLPPSTSNCVLWVKKQQRGRRQPAVEARRRWRAHQHSWSFQKETTVAHIMWRQWLRARSEPTKPRHPLGLGMPLSNFQLRTLAHKPWPRDPRRLPTAACSVEAGWIVERIEGIAVVFQRRTHRRPLTTPNLPSRPPPTPGHLAKMA